MALIRSLTPSSASRLIFVGDIHGCYDELVALLERVAPASDDVVVSVGDVVRKGPAADRCLELWRDRGYHAVLGNNELRVLKRARPLLRFFAREDREVLRRGDLLRYIRSWPLVVDFPERGIAAVHGGFLPHMRMTEEDVQREQEIVPKLRWIRRKDGRWISIPNHKRQTDDVLWAGRWKGDRFLVYGHTPLEEPKFDRQALGLDTGCVYGRSLTAAIHERGEWTTVSVPARRRYAG